MSKAFCFNVLREDIISCSRVTKSHDFCLVQEETTRTKILHINKILAHSISDETVKDQLLQDLYLLLDI